MHDCPECGQACDCDGEDTWFENYLGCTHDCEEYEEYELEEEFKFDDDLIPENDPAIFGFCQDCGRPTPACICQIARLWQLIDSPRTRRLHRAWKCANAAARHQRLTTGKHVSRARRAKKSRRNSR